MSIVYIRKKMGGALKYILGAILLIFAVGIFVSFGPNRGGRSAGSRAAEVIARVNGQPVSRRQFLIEVDYTRRGAYGAGLADARHIKMMALERIIRDIIQAQAMKDLKVRASREDVDAAIQAQVDARTVGQDRKTLREYLEQNDMTYEEYLREITAEVRSNRRQIEQQVKLDKLRQKIAGEVKVTDRDLREAYRRIKGRRIVIRPDEIEASGADSKSDLSPDERKALAKAKAEAILSRLKDGADFAELAKKESHGPEAQDGGDFGSLGYDALKIYFGKDVADAVWTLQPGEHTGVLETEEGYQIFKCEQISNRLPDNFEDIKEEERQRLLARRQEEHFNEYMRSRRDAAKVEIEDPELKAYWLLDNEDGREDEAYALLQQALEATIVKKEDGGEEDVGDPTINFELAQLAESLNKPQEAEHYYMAAAKAAGSSPDLHIALGRFYLKQGRKEEALAAFATAREGARDLTTANSRAHYELKDIYEEMGEESLAAAEQKWIEDYINSRPAPIFPTAGTPTPISPQ
ncbi:MAG: SurA N-terminal domain-containing protein [Armatimonadota bacterium]